MKESQFIKQSEKKWKNFEEDLKLDRKNPERTSKLFIQITDDLSYARTFYPNRMVRKYLDGVSQILLGRIYKNQRIKWSSFMKFWSTTLPLEVYRARRAFTIATVVFVLAFLIGALSAYHEPEFVRVILGDVYVEMTLENIAKDDPMAVYKDFNAAKGFASITINNISVAFNTFVSGLVAAIGTIYVLLYNGIMVGAFQYFFLEKGVFWESFLTIWQHGTLEISAIVIAGAAGITMGAGLIFTGSYTRLQSFKISGKRGIIIFLGTIPLFIMAGFIEGFLTRFTEAPMALRLGVISSSALFIFYYFGWYPRKVAKANPEALEKDIPVEESISAEFKEGTIYKAEELVRMSFISLLKKPGFIVLLYAIGSGISYLYLNIKSAKTEDSEVFVNPMAELTSIFNYSGELTLAAFLAFSTLFISMVSHSRAAGISFFRAFSLQKLALSATLMLPVLSFGFWVLLAALYPLMAFWSTNSTGAKADYTTPKLLSAAMKKAYGITGLMIFFGLVIHILFSVLNSVILMRFYEIFIGDYELAVYVSEVVYYASAIGSFLIGHALTCKALYYLKFTSKETLTADHLMERIRHFELKHNLISEDV